VSRRETAPCSRDGRHAGEIFNVTSTAALFCCTVGGPHYYATVFNVLHDIFVLRVGGPHYNETVFNVPHVINTVGGPHYNETTRHRIGLLDK